MTVMKLISEFEVSSLFLQRLTEAEAECGENGGGSFTDAFIHSIMYVLLFPEKHYHKDVREWMLSQLVPDPVPPIVPEPSVLTYGSEYPVTSVAPPYRPLHSVPSSDSVTHQTKDGLVTVKPWTDLSRLPTDHVRRPGPSADSPVVNDTLTSIVNEDDRDYIPIPILPFQ